MKKRSGTIIYIVITIILVAAILLLGINLYNKKTLDKEVKNIKENKKNINTKSTSTYFEYKKVELAIKEYTNDYSEILNKINSIMNDESLKNVLSVSSIEKDGKELNNSIALVNNKEKELSEEIKKLYTLNEKKEILKYIENKNTSKKYIELYKEYMFNDEDLEKNKKSIDDLNNKYENILKTDLEVLNLLKNNASSWVISEGKIGFYSNDLMNSYNELIKKIK
jgi:hypothetical protein